MVTELKVIGGAPLRGTVEISSDEQAILACQAASLLATSGTVILDHVPARAAVVAMNKFLQQLGVRIVFDRPKQVLKLDAGWHITPAPLELGNLLAAGTVLARCQQVTLPAGKTAEISREIREITKVLTQLGAQVENEGNATKLTAQFLTGTTLDLGGVSLAAAVTAITVATLTRGITVLNRVPKVPALAELVALLQKMGARIHEGKGQTLRIQGVTALHSADHYINDDQGEAAVYLVAGALTAGDLLVSGAMADYLQPLLDHLEAAGNTVIVQRNGIRVIGTRILLPADEQPALTKLADPRVEAALLALHARQLGGSRLAKPFFWPELVESLGTVMQEDGGDLVSHGPLAQMPEEAHYVSAAAGLALYLLALPLKQNTWLPEVERIEEAVVNLTDRLQGLGANLVRGVATVDSLRFG